ncbi:MAG: hypothetical protein JSR71_09865 [Proteobacteria bacterium]|nr:hypothetical protein [Pseudomonadota bacterium]
MRWLLYKVIFRPGRSSAREITGVRKNVGISADGGNDSSLRYYGFGIAEVADY